MCDSFEIKYAAHRLAIDIEMLYRCDKKANDLAASCEEVIRTILDLARRPKQSDKES